MPMVFTGPAVALGPIADEFSATATELAWVTNAFMLSFGSCLLTAGALADRYGRRRVFLCGAGLFLIASLGLALSPHVLIFNLLRCLQGVAAAAVLAGGSAALAEAFEGPARTRAFSWLGTSFGVGLVLGPITAGVLTDGLGWRAIFGLSICVMLVAFALAARTMPSSRASTASPFDWTGAVLFTLALSAVTWAAVLASAQSWSSPTVIGTLLIAFGLLSAFVFFERRTPVPMLQLTLFSNARFLGIQMLAAAPAYAFVVLLVLLPVRFSGIEAIAPQQAGWMMAALSGPLLFLPLLAGQAARRWSPAALCCLGLLLAAGGLWGLAHAHTTAALIASMTCIGMGISLPWGLMDGLAVSVVPAEQAGMAAGIFSTVRVAGEGIALALVGSALTTLIRIQMPGGDRAQAAAQLLAAGRMSEASSVALVPATQLVFVYEQAFSGLLRGLAAITVFTAVVVLALLGPRKAASERPEALTGSEELP